MMAQDDSSSDSEDAKPMQNHFALKQSPKLVALKTQKSHTNAEKDKIFAQAS